MVREFVWVIFLNVLITKLMERKKELNREYKKIRFIIGNEIIVDSQKIEEKYSDINAKISDLTILIANQTNKDDEEREKLKKDISEVIKCMENFLYKTYFMICEEKIDILIKKNNSFFVKIQGRGKVGGDLFKLSQDLKNATDYSHLESLKNICNKEIPKVIVEITGTKKSGSLMFILMLSFAILGIIGRDLISFLWTLFFSTEISLINSVSTIILTMGIALSFFSLLFGKPNKKWKMI